MNMYLVLMIWQMKEDYMYNDSKTQWCMVGFIYWWNEGASIG